MRPDDWHLTDDVDSFLDRAADFLHSRPALHTLPLTVTEALRTRGQTRTAPTPPSSVGWSGLARSAPLSSTPHPAA